MEKEEKYMNKGIFNTYLGQKLENGHFAKKNRYYYLDIAKNRLVVDKNKEGQVLLFHNLISSLITNHTNEEIQIALIDYENKFYKGYEDNDRFFPPIAHNKEETVEMLDFIVKLQKARIALMKECNVKNIEEYNKQEFNKIPYFFIFIDELDYLMNDEQIDKLISLITLSRCAGIIIYAGTSKLDKTRTLCGKVKANFINRICFKVDSKEESKHVIDKYGAEDLHDVQVLVDDAMDTTNVVLGFGAFRKSKDDGFMYKNYLFLDVETNGLDYNKDEIIKFYYVLTDNKLKVKNKEAFFVNTGNTIISPEISQITHITQKDIDNGKNREFLADLLKNIINSETLVISYNIRFTMGFIASFLEKNNLSNVLYNVNYLDLLRVFRLNEKDQKNYRIKNAVEFYKIREKNIAERETEIYLKLFKKMMKKYDLKLFVGNNF